MLEKNLEEEIKNNCCLKNIFNEIKFFRKELIDVTTIFDYYEIIGNNDVEDVVNVFNAKLNVLVLHLKNDLKLIDEILKYILDDYNGKRKFTL